MKREWKPGDVALVNVSEDRWAMGVLDHNDDWTLALPMGDEGWVHNDPGELAIRPAVVIDPEDREQVERLRNLYVRASRGEFEQQPNESWMQAALREFANPTPPKPDEPKGLGAVVEDASGYKWVRTERHTTPPLTHWWVRPGVSTPHWHSIDAVKVLSPGVPVE